MTHNAHRSLFVLALAAGAAFAQVPQRPVSTTIVASTYDSSVQALMQAADQLRASIHAMAREPAGPRRNQAIREANQALLDTQAAMAQAFDATYAANPASTTTVTLGAGPNARTIVLGPGNTARCVKLGDMVGCK